MKDWALAKGATHYAHVFYPLTGLTAEKHDSFLSPDGEGGAIAEFSGKTLVQGEPDASSFPNGGIRATFEARGYTAWDVTSPAYILETPNGTTLCIPTAFVSWTGEALDKKTPLLRSSQALNTQAQRILKLFGHEKPAMVVSYAGAEQEYFLIDKHFFYARPDLLNAGRTLFGAKPPKGQEFEDHYFGVDPRARARLHAGGRARAVQARHPGQDAPQRGRARASSRSRRCSRAPTSPTDHQQLVMVDAEAGRREARPGLPAAREALRRRQRLGQARQLLVRQRDAGQPARSGRHAARQRAVPGVLRRGHSRRAQVRAACCARSSRRPATITAWAPTKRRRRSSRSSSASSSTDVFEQIKAGGAKSSKTKGTLEIGVDTLPKLPKDAGDRNRTSPFAFTGNRFEFRAVGSGQSIGDPLVALNTIIAESLDYVATKLESRGRPAARSSTPRSRTCWPRSSTSTARSSSTATATRPSGTPRPRSAACRTSRPPSTRCRSCSSRRSIALFDKYKVLSPRELHGRYEIYLEQYSKTVNVEAKLTAKIAKTIDPPGGAALPERAGRERHRGEGGGVHARHRRVLKQVTELIGKLQAGLGRPRDAPPATTARDGALGRGQALLRRRCCRRC